MVTKEELKNWFQNDLIRKRKLEIESYIDKKIKENVLNGLTSFSIPTMRIDDTINSYTTNTFGQMWYSKDLSKEASNRIKIEIVLLYRENDFDIGVEKVNIPFTNEYYDSISIKNIHLMIR